MWLMMAVPVRYSSVGIQKFCCYIEKAFQLVESDGKKTTQKKKKNFTHQYIPMVTRLAIVASIYSEYFLTKGKGGSLVAMCSEQPQVRTENPTP